MKCLIFLFHEQKERMENAMRRLPMSFKKTLGPGYSRNHGCPNIRASRSPYFSVKRKAFDKTTQTSSAARNASRLRSNDGNKSHSMRDSNKKPIP
ncbi:hypothetical protein [Fretibacterium fastidiosum]|uniref:hypothetical protein n=1 Tax=Fretibacterium fastidiosum TaxID=651822 RepID=UPI001AD80B6D|nr:hypothetical protein [Fretibacterium fastidiosum]